VIDFLKFVREHWFVFLSGGVLLTGIQLLFVMLIIMVGKL
jgi:hypothetical protein